MVQSRTGDPWEKKLDCQVSGHCYLEKAGLGIFSWLVYICQTLLPFCMKKTPNPFHWGPMHVCICHGWKYVRIYTEMRKIEMCIRRSPYFDNFQNEKNKNIFVSILFRNLVQSIHPTTCRSMFSEANACRRVAGSGGGIPALYIWEVQSSLKNMPCLSEGYELSVAIDKNVKNK